jgi:hypothetical protein
VATAPWKGGPAGADRPDLHWTGRRGGEGRPSRHVEGPLSARSAAGGQAGGLLPAARRSRQCPAARDERQGPAALRARKGRSRAHRDADRLARAPDPRRQTARKRSASSSSKRSSFWLITNAPTAPYGRRTSTGTEYQGANETNCSRAFPSATTSTDCCPTSSFSARVWTSRHRLDHADRHQTRAGSGHSDRRPRRSEEAKTRIRRWRAADPDLERSVDALRVEVDANTGERVQRCSPSSSCVSEPASDGHGHHGRHNAIPPQPHPSMLSLKSGPLDKRPMPPLLLRMKVKCHLRDCRLLWQGSCWCG